MDGTEAAWRASQAQQQQQWGMALKGGRKTLIAVVAIVAVVLVGGVAIMAVASHVTGAPHSSSPPSHRR
jgi:hypothetical protein